MDYAESVRAQTTLPLLLTGGLRTAATMARVVESGSVDMIGMARPLAVEPDLPARILAGRTERARPHDISVGIRLLDNMLQLVWYQRQMARMAAGLEPTPKLSRWWSVLVGFASSFAFNPLSLLRRDRRRAMARLPA